MPLIDFAAGRLDVRYHAADTHVVDVDWSVDLEGYDVASNLVSLPGGAVIAELETVVTDAGAGKARVVFPSGLAAGTYLWNQRWWSDDESQTGFVGYVEVLP
jgi:hypothetical protein